MLFGCKKLSRQLQKIFKSLSLARNCAQITPITVFLFGLIKFKLGHNPLYTTDLQQNMKDFKWGREWMFMNEYPKNSKSFLKNPKDSNLILRIPKDSKRF